MRADGSLHHPQAPRSRAGRHHHQLRHVRDLQPDPEAVRRPARRGLLLRRQGLDARRRSPRSSTRSGLDLPWWEQYFNYMKGILFGRTLTDGSTTVTCAAPCFGYSFRLNSSVWELMKTGVPGDLQRDDRRVHAVAGRRRLHRRHLGAAPRVVLRPRGHDLRPRGGVAAGVLHRGAAPADLQLRPGLAADLPQRDLCAVHREPGAVVPELDTALDIAGLPVRGPVRAVHPREHAGDDGGGLHPDRHRQGTAAPVGRRPARRCGPRSPRS